MRDELLPGATVTIRVDGEDLIEHNTTSDVRLPATNAFIEAIPGASFSVEVKLGIYYTYLKNDVNVTTEVDGVMVSKRTESTKRRHEITINGCWETSNGKAYEKRFIFSNLVTTDSTPKGRDFETLKKIAEISVTLKQCSIVSRDYAWEDSTNKRLSGEGVPETGPEGAAIVSRAQLAEAQSIKKYNKVTCEYPHGRTPIGRFKFYHRMHKDLQTEGIIARSPSPAPLECRDPSSLSHEEAFELVRRLRAREAEALHKKVKAKMEKGTKRGRTATSESSGNSGDDEIVVTEESNRSKRAKATEVIDLSDE